MFKFNYFLNKNTQPNGDHEVHKEGCYWMPLLENRIYLGVFTNGIGAVNYAKNLYPNAQIDGCVHCSEEAHHS